MKIIGLIILVAIVFGFYYAYSNGILDDFVKTTEETKQTYNEIKETYNEINETYTDINEKIDTASSFLEKLKNLFNKEENEVVE